MKDSEQGASALPTGPSQAEPEVSALRASVPCAEEIAEAAAATLKPELFAPRIRKITDEIYETLMFDVQDYLRENVRWNIGQRIREAENRALLAHQQLREISDHLGWSGGGQDWRLARIAEIKKHVPTPSPNPPPHPRKES